jgi:hypothetical protein
VSDVAKKLLDSSRRESGGELVTHWKAARLSISDMPFAVRIVLLLVARAGWYVARPAAYTPLYYHTLA